MFIRKKYSAIAFLSCDWYVVPWRISAGNLQALQNDHWPACHALKNPLPLMKEIVEKEDNGNVVMKVSTNTLRDGGEGDVFGIPPAPTLFYKHI